MRGKAPGFYITGGKGFHIVFENGASVSVQFGPGNYCDHYDRRIGVEEEKCGRVGSSTAECAFWFGNGDLQPFGGDDADTVNGWMTPREVLALMNRVAAEGGRA